jgi:hypothetical protein
LFSGIGARSENEPCAANVGGTCNWYLPFLMQPETPFEEGDAMAPAAAVLTAGYKNR